MDEDEEMLYREMNPEDDFYMGPDREEYEDYDDYEPRHNSGGNSGNSNPAPARSGCMVLIAIIMFTAILL